MRWRLVWYQCHHQAFIILALLYPVGPCTLKSQCILISCLEIDAPMRIRLCNRLTTWQFIKQISGKAATWKQQLHLAHSCALSQFSADFDWGVGGCGGVGRGTPWHLSIERLKMKFLHSAKELHVFQKKSHIRKTFQRGTRATTVICFQETKHFSDGSGKWECSRPSKGSI